MKKRKTYIAVIIILAAAIAVLVGYIVYALAFSDSARIRRLCASGNRYLDDGNYDEAIAAFEKALLIDPYCLDAYDGKADAQTEKAQQADNYDDMLSGLLEAYFTYDDAVRIMGNAGIDIPEWFTDAQKRAADAINDNVEQYVNELIDQGQYDVIEKIREEYGPYSDYDFDSVINDADIDEEAEDDSENNAGADTSDNESGDVQEAAEETGHVLKVTFIKDDSDLNRSLVYSPLSFNMNGEEMRYENDGNGLTYYDNEGNIAAWETVEDGNPTYIITEPQWYYSFTIEPTPDADGMHNEDLTGMRAVITYDGETVRTLDVDNDYEFKNRYPTGHWAFDFAVNNGNIEYTSQ